MHQRVLHVEVLRVVENSHGISVALSGLLLLVDGRSRCRILVVYRQGCDSVAAAILVSSEVVEIEVEN